MDNKDNRDESLSDKDNKKFSFEHWHAVTVLLMIYDAFALSLSYFCALWFRFDNYGSIPSEYLKRYITFIPFYIVGSIIIFWILKLYKSIWRFASYNELLRLVVATGVTFVLHIVGMVLFVGSMPRSYYLFGVILQFILTIGVRFAYRFILLLRNQVGGDTTLQRRVMIIGAGEAGQLILRDIKHSEKVNERVYCMIDDNPNKWNRYIDGVPVVGGSDSIFEAVEEYTIEKIYVALPSATVEERREILNICKETGCEIKNLPGLYQFMTGQISIASMKNVEVEDLLGRDVIKVNMDEIFQYIKGKTVLVTGGGGSIGSELCRQVADHHPEKLIIFDVYENNAYDIQLELRKKHPELSLEVLIGSVRDSRKIFQVFETYKPDIVYHAAAHKHVPLMEDSPCEAIKNNAIGTYKTAYAAMANGCSKFVLISTDKAVNPTNIIVKPQIISGDLSRLFKAEIPVIFCGQ